MYSRLYIYIYINLFCLPPAFLPLPFQSVASSLPISNQGWVLCHLSLWLWRTHLKHHIHKQKTAASGSHNWWYLHIHYMNTLLLVFVVCLVFYLFGNPDQNTIWGHLYVCISHVIYKREVETETGKAIERDTI